MNNFCSSSYSIAISEIIPIDVKLKLKLSTLSHNSTRDTQNVFLSTKEMTRVTCLSANVIANIQAYIQNPKPRWAAWSCGMRSELSYRWSWVWILPQHTNSCTSFGIMEVIIINSEGTSEECKTNKWTLIWVRVEKAQSLSCEISACNDNVWTKSRKQ